MPSAAENPITTHSVACPPHASAASVELRTVAPSCVASSSLRRSTRSARPPAHGDRTSTGTNWQKLRTPRRNGECVRRKTRIDAARFWNHVPLADAALPAKYGAKLRDLITRHAAEGPTVAPTLLRSGADQAAASAHGAPSSLRPTRPVQLRVDPARGLRRHPGDAFELLLRGRDDALRRAEMLQQ